jgi:hypothetical protein
MQKMQVRCQSFVLTFLHLFLKHVYKYKYLNIFLLLKTPTSVCVVLTFLKFLMVNNQCNVKLASQPACSYIVRRLLLNNALIIRLALFYQFDNYIIGELWLSKIFEVTHPTLLIYIYFCKGCPEKIRKPLANRLCILV